MYSNLLLHRSSTIFVHSRYSSLIPLQSSSIHRLFAPIVFNKETVNINNNVQSRNISHRSSYLLASDRPGQNPSARSTAPNPADSSNQQQLLRALRQQPRRPQLRDSRLFQSSDGLDPNEWTLIYHNRTTLWLFTMIVVYSTVCLVFIAIAIQQMSERSMAIRQRKESLTVKSIVSRDIAANLLLGLAVFATLIRFRRCWVVRIYEKNWAKTGKPPPSIVIESVGANPQGKLPPTATSSSNFSSSNPPPVREYCIVWVDFIFRRRLYRYKNTETDRILENAPFFRNILGNFRAKTRPFAVFQHYFEDNLDYYRVRGKNVAGNVYVA